MASVVIAPTARGNLDILIETRSLPASARERFRRSLEPLHEFPLLGAPLGDRWSGFRFILGPWRWMLVVYRYDEELDQVAIVTIQDARSARAATSSR